MTLGRLVGTLMLGLALAGCASSAGGSGNAGQCKEGRVWYRGECCPDDNDNGICDWVDDGSVPPGDAYSSGDAGGVGPTPEMDMTMEDIYQTTDTFVCTNECLKNNPAGHYCEDYLTLIVCGDCNTPPYAQLCPEGTTCQLAYDECK